jgi:hypothetical protein
VGARFFLLSIDGCATQSITLRYLGLGGSEPCPHSNQEQKERKHLYSYEGHPAHSQNPLKKNELHGHVTMTTNVIRKTDSSKEGKGT